MAVRCSDYRRGQPLRGAVSSSALGPTDSGAKPSGGPPDVDHEEFSRPGRSERLSCPSFGIWRRPGDDLLRLTSCREYRGSPVVQTNHEPNLASCPLALGAGTGQLGVKVGRIASTGSASTWDYSPGALQSGRDTAGPVPYKPATGLKGQQS